MRQASRARGVRSARIGGRQAGRMSVAPANGGWRTANHVARLRCHAAHRRSRFIRFSAVFP
ncbi:hypothetical protein A33K_17459 [Burkholderia humptydooensis MSMB43]|uniref:Uncharacterized protein n=1 Tax=Burkholderia humptydooensis MSMB43 TaxID=441157 RepID=A0ABN0G291_9BURK|nr:hypothetical protein A33K_17459 [Burkholderia humptydooensis MSMB43]